MKLLRIAAAIGAASAVALCSAGAAAQGTIKIGLIVPMTGQQASTGKQISAAAKLYMQQKGDTVAGKKIELIIKDDGAVPDNTKRVAQELIVNDKVRRTKPVMLDHFSFLKSVTTKTAKFCMPSATYLHLRGGRKLVDQKAYPDMAEFWDDIATVYQQDVLLCIDRSHSMAYVIRLYSVRISSTSE